MSVDVLQRRFLIKQCGWRRDVFRPSEFYCEELPPNRWKRLFPIVLRGGGVFTVASLTATQAEHVIS